MVRFLLTLTLILLTEHRCCAMSVDESINNLLTPAAQVISNVVFYPVRIFGVDVELIVILLMSAALFFTVGTKFVGGWGFRHALELITKRFLHPVRNKKKQGEVSSFQALTSTISSSVGLGNIAGVAVGISYGGPGVLFWMIVAGLFSMSLKFSEVFLGIKYRIIDENGAITGGPMYYIRDGLKNTRLRFLANPLSKFYAFCMVLACIGGWNLFQVNAIKTQILEAANINSGFLFGNCWIIGLVLSLITAVIVFGGVKSIGKVAEKITPFMCLLYVFAGLAVMWIYHAQIPAAVCLVIKEAFNPAAVQGGFIAVVIWGFRRAMFSNESGLGTAPIFYSTVKTNQPVAQSFIAMIQPFVDTIIVCSITAFVIILTGEYANHQGYAGVELTSKAFEHAIPFFPVVLAVIVLLFGFSTLICGSYYGEKSFEYLFGKKPIFKNIFRVIYCLLIIVGSVMNFKSIMQLSDAFTLSLAIPNLIAVFALSPFVFKSLKAYCERYNIGIYKQKHRNRSYKSIKSFTAKKPEVKVDAI